MEAMRTARRRLRRLKRQLQMVNDSIDRLIIRYSGRIISLPTRRVGNLLLFPGPELGEEGLDVRGFAYDRGDGTSRPYFVRTALAMRSVLGSSRRRSLPVAGLSWALTRSSLTISPSWCRPG